jgi:hypothetical protein
LGEDERTGSISTHWAPSVAALRKWMSTNSQKSTVSEAVGSETAKQAAMKRGLHLDRKERKNNDKQRCKDFPWVADRVLTMDTVDGGERRATEIPTGGKLVVLVLNGINMVK